MLMAPCLISVLSLIKQNWLYILYVTAAKMTVKNNIGCAPYDNKARLQIGQQLFL